MSDDTTYHEEQPALTIDGEPLVVPTHDAEAAIAKPDASTPSRQKKPATLVQAGERYVTSDGRFHADLVATYVLERREQWVKIADLAKIFGGGNTKEGHRKVRKNMSIVFGVLLGHGDFLLYNTAARGRIASIKLLDIKNEHEMSAALPQLERMRRRHQITTDKYQTALRVISIHEQA